MRLLRPAIVCASLLVLSRIGNAFAANPGVDLAWDSCAPSGPLNEGFACNSDQGTSQFVISFVAPLIVEQVNSISALVAIDQVPSSVQPTPAWWQLQAGGCRAGSLSMSTGAGPDDAGCAQLNAPGGTTLTYGTPFQLPGRAGLGVGETFASPENLVEGQAYFAFRIVVDHSKTAGADSCSGCSAPMSITLQRVVLDATTTSSILTSPVHQSTITWQQPSVPAFGVTWGRVKALYRQLLPR